MQSLIISFFNFFVLVILLGYFLRSPLRAFVHNRQKQIREDFLMARSHLKEAREKYDEFSSKLAAIETEIIQLRNQNTQELVTLKESSAHQIAAFKARIFSDAEQRVQILFDDFKKRLRTEWTQAVLDHVEQIIQSHLNPADHKRMDEEFLSQLKKVSL